MIHNHDRSGWFGASDTAMIMGNWKTQTFEKWWMVKLGLRKDDFSSIAMRTGTEFEHRILESIGVKKMDRQIRKRRFRLRVNLDGETRSAIYEVKTYGANSFKVSKAYWQQAQVEMYATQSKILSVLNRFVSFFGGRIRCRKSLKIVAYHLEADDYQNWFRPVETDRITFHPIEYDQAWIESEYLPRLKHLAECLRKGVFPDGNGL